MEQQKEKVGNVLLRKWNIRIKTEADRCIQFDEFYRELAENILIINSFAKFGDTKSFDEEDIEWTFGHYSDKEFKQKLYIYVFKVQVGELSFQIHKQYKDFKDLHLKLNKTYTELSQPRIATSYQSCLIELNSYLTKAIHLAEDSENQKILANFQQLPIQSFTSSGQFNFPLYQKYGILFCGGMSNKNADCCHKLFFHLTNHYNEDHTFLTEEGQCFIKYNKKSKDSTDYKVLRNIFFDQQTKISIGFKKTYHRYGFKIVTGTKQFTMLARSRFEFQVWIHQLAETMKKSPYVKKHQFGSFAPIRKNNNVKAYLNADEYFDDIFEAIENAEYQILITDWMFSPELYLKRPIEDYPESRLDKTLERAAIRGVEVRIQLYKEFSAMPNGSQHALDWLEKLHPNIEVQRHPIDIVFFWSHHEKICVIDRTIGFMGGLDLCFGRYCTKEHRLQEQNSEKTYFPGQDYNNVRLCDYKDVHEYDKCLIEKNVQPRMPWRDIACRIIGDSVIDLTRHFIQQWNWTGNCRTGAKAFVCGASFTKIKEKLASGFHKNLGKIKRKKVEKEAIEDSTQEKIDQNKEDILEQYESTGYMSLQTNDDENNAEYTYEIVQLISKGQLARERWQDAIFMVMDENREHSGKDTTYTRLMHYIKKSKREPRFDVVPKKGTIVEKKKEKKDKIFSAIEMLPTTSKKINSTGDITNDHNQTLQIQRSAGSWQLGLDETEKSIQSAYLGLIQRAKSFIYIENQFFISGTAGDMVTNQITNVLTEKIISKIKANEKFKVLILMPLMPGNDGSLKDGSGNFVRKIMAYQYYTINKAEKSIIKQIMKYTSHPEKYIKFIGLRTHDIMRNGIPDTSQVYIHTKAMIVDDEVLILGSANINDRSMTGVRDSELAVVISDRDMVDSKFDGENVELPRISHELRKKCFMESFGMEADEVLDPMDDCMWDEIENRVKTNTECYRKIFGCYPDNLIKTTPMIDEIEGEGQITIYDELKDKIKGFAVELPLDFLGDEDIKSMYYFESKSALLPTSTFL